MSSATSAETASNKCEDTRSLARKILSRQVLLSDLAILAYFASLKFLFLFLINEEYGFHRDEFLYIAMRDHLAWGYLEVPPSIAFFAKLSGGLFGDSLYAFRFFPAWTGAATVFIIGLMTRELGGGRFAQVLAALAFIVSPACLRINILFQPVSFDLFYWVMGGYLLIRLLKKSQPHLWIAMGLICGLGLMNKYTMLLFGFGLLVGLLLTYHRKMLLTIWPWLVGAIVFLIILPNLVWQFNHGWPLFEHLQELSRSQLVNVRPSEFMIMQILMNLSTFPIWMIGLYFCLISENGRLYRPLGWMYLSILAILLFLSGKAYYLLPAYPMLFACGSFAIEKFIIRKNWRWLKPAIVTLVVINSIVPIPYGIPIMSVNTFKKYAQFMAENFKLVEPLRWETGEIHSIPQDFADMFGWENQVATTARVFYTLSDEEKASCTIFAGNYGEAGALGYFGDRYDLPKPICVNGSYYLWGPGNSSGEILLTVGISREYLEGNYAEIELAATITHEIARETDIPIYICRNPKTSLREAWPKLKQYRY